MSKRFHPSEMKVPPVLPEIDTTSPKPKTLLLINPFYPKDPHASFGKHVLTPSLALTSIAGATPDDWEIVYWDENLLKGGPPVNPFPQVVGITVHLTFAKRAYELSSWFRSRGAVVVMGGLHASSTPDEVAEQCDVLVVGEGTQVWPNVLRDIEGNTHQPRYSGDYRRPYSKDPAPNRRVLPRKDFLTTSSLIATRGCHNRCGFCYLSTKGLHMPYRLRDVEQVVEEIRDDGQPYSVFIDNNLGSRPDYLRKLCQALEPLEIIWSAAVTIDVTDDESLVKDMAKSGCTGVFVGFESLNLGNLKAARKKTPAPSDYSRRVCLLHRYGIQVNGSFVLGFDHDDIHSFQRTVDWIEENRMECATFHILTPYPGTPLFRELQQQNRILHTEWEKYDTAHVVFKPNKLTVEELEAGYGFCYEQLFSHGSIWRRRPRDLSAMPAYLAMSYLYKKSNRLWHWLIKRQLTATVWGPLIELSRQRHLRYRKKLLRGVNTGSPGNITSPSV